VAPAPNALTHSDINCPIHQGPDPRKVLLDPVIQPAPVLAPSITLPLPDGADSDQAHEFHVVAIEGYNTNGFFFRNSWGWTGVLLCIAVDPLLEGILNISLGHIGQRHVGVSTCLSRDPIDIQKIITPELQAKVEQRHTEKDRERQKKH